MHSSSLRVNPFACLLLLGSSGCAEYEMSTGDADTGWLAWDTAGGVSTSSDDSPDTTVSWWKLDSDLTLADGQVLLAKSRIVVHLLDVDSKRLCSAEAPITAAELEEVPDPLVLSWWAISLDEWAGGCITGSETDQVLPPPQLSNLYVGIGTMHPDILSVVGTLDDAVDGADQTLNGAYASLNGGTDIYVYGVAGLDVAYQAVEGPAAEAPLGDGTWRLRAIYPFSFGSF